MGDATALVAHQQSAFAVLPAPRTKLRDRRNARRLAELRGGGLTRWWNESAGADAVSDLLDSEGFVILDGFCGSECATLRDQADELLTQRAGRGRMGSAASTSGGTFTGFRGDLSLWEEGTSSGALPLSPLLGRISSLVARLAAEGRPTERETRSIDRRSEVQVSVFPAAGTRYVRHVDNECARGEGWRCNGRRLTAIYYLNPEWSVERDGGALRILRRDGSGSTQEVWLLSSSPPMP